MVPVFVLCGLVLFGIRFRFGRFSFWEKKKKEEKGEKEEQKEKGEEMSWPSSTRLMRSTGHCREPRDFCSGQRIKQAGILFPTIVEFVRVVWEQGTCVRGSDKWRCRQRFCD